MGDSGVLGYAEGVGYRAIGMTVRHEQADLCLPAGERQFRDVSGQPHSHRLLVQDRDADQAGRRIGAALGFVVFVLPVAADSALQPLKVSKECSQYSGGVPSFCTVTESSLGAIKTGSKILYYGPVANNPAFSSNNVVLDDGAGNTAAGNCIVDFGAGPAGLCAFYGGNGTLAGFQAIVKVTKDANQIRHWDGSYVLAPAAD